MPKGKKLDLSDLGAYSDSATANIPKAPAERDDNDDGSFRRGRRPDFKGGLQLRSFVGLAMMLMPLTQPSNTTRACTVYQLAHSNHSRTDEGPPPPSPQNNNNNITPFLARSSFVTETSLL